MYQVFDVLQEEVGGGGCNGGDQRRNEQTKQRELKKLLIAQGTCYFVFDTEMGNTIIACVVF